MNGSAASVAVALAGQLVELGAVIEQTDDVTYVAVREDGVSNSMGAHVRHTIDHVAALIDPKIPGRVDYDDRRRGSDVERSRIAARAELQRLTRQLRWLSDDALMESVELTAVIDRTGARVRAWSTVARELVFVLSHTIHHHAIIALLLASAGRATPDRFGFAPSTPGRVPCVRSA